MSNNPDQIFYITYSDDNNGRLTSQISKDAYNKLGDDDKKKYTQVIVDLQHLYGWGRWWDTVCYRDGALQYPGNWEKDQSEQITDLKKQLSDIIASNKAKEQSNHDLEAKLAAANDKIAKDDQQLKGLGALTMNLQAQIAKVTPEKAPAKTNDSNVAKSMAASAAAK